MTQPFTPEHNTSGRYHPASDRNRFPLDDVDLDIRIRHASTRVFVSKDLLRPRPGIVPFGHRGFLPFGKKAQARREARATVDQEAAQRRTALRSLLEQRLYPKTSRPGNAPGDSRSTPRQARLILLAVVLVIVVAGIWTTRKPGTATTPLKEPIRIQPMIQSASSPQTYSAEPAGAPPLPGNSNLSDSNVSNSTDSVGSSPEGGVPSATAGAEQTMPFPATGVPAITMIPDLIATQPANTEVAANLVAPGTPEAAVALWAALWCPIDYRQDWRTQRKLLRPLVTVDGFDWYTQNQPDQPPADWSKIVAQHQVTTCDQPIVEPVTAAPRTDTSATVQLRITRTTTATLAGAEQSSFVDQLRLQLQVQRTADGPWLVGAPRWAG